MSLYKKSEYNQEQLDFLKMTATSALYASVSDLDPKCYTAEQMREVSISRVEWNMFQGNIDDLDPSKYNNKQMQAVSWGRSKEKNTET